MGTKIHIGVNLSFAKYVYGRKRALQIARRRLGLTCAEMVADNDFGGAFYVSSPEAFRRYHYEIADHARSVGIQIPGVFTVYRETGAIADAHPDIRESAYQIGVSLLEQAACYGAKYVGAALFTMNRETAEDPERFQAQFLAAIEMWKRWMGDARRIGVPLLLIEMAAAYREGCSTIDDTAGTLREFAEFHEKNPDTTVPVGLCYDTGHGISPTENRDDANRDFREWFRSFPDSIHTIHLKNTDPQFLETWHLQHEEGIINIREVVEAIRDTLTVPELFLQLEVPGKRGREIGEENALEDHLNSLEYLRSVLRDCGYVEEPEVRTWTHPDQAD
ncbi:MAG: TIM barrel protein [Planctomycetota bacterium]